MGLGTCGARRRCRVGRRQHWLVDRAQHHLALVPPNLSAMIFLLRETKMNQILVRADTVLVYQPCECASLVEANV
jgi:hypothetical protein